MRLGLGAAPTAVLAAPLWKYMALTYPRIKGQLAGGPAEHQLQGLREWRVDALVIHRRTLPPSEDVELTLFPGMRNGFICRRDHPLCGPKRVLLEPVA